MLTNMWILCDYVSMNREYVDLISEDTEPQNPVDRCIFSISMGYSVLQCCKVMSGNSAQISFP